MLKSWDYHSDFVTECRDYRNLARKALLHIFQGISLAGGSQANRRLAAALTADEQLRIDVDRINKALDKD